MYYYRPKRSFGQGNIFTSVCDSVHGGGGTWQVHPPGRYTPREGTPPQAGTPPGQVPPREGTPPGQVHTPFGRYTPRAGTHPLGRYAPLGRYTPQTGTSTGQVHPPDRYTPRAGTPPPGQVHPPLGTADYGIRSTFGRYASYWNAFLFAKFFEAVLNGHLSINEISRKGRWSHNTVTSIIYTNGRWHTFGCLSYHIVITLVISQ